jgi:hypothetical protein
MLERMGRDRQTGYWDAQAGRQEITDDELRIALGILRRTIEPKSTYTGEGSRKTNPVVKLSTMMVDLSIQHNRHDPLFTDIPTPLPAKSECNPSQPKIPPVSASLAITAHEELTKAVQLERNTETQGRLVQACGKLLRRFISEVRDHVRIHDSRLLTAVGVVALALLGFGTVHEWRAFHSASVKGRAQILPAAQQPDKPLVPATSTASEKTGNNAHIVAPSKSKSRRRQGDYVAKDTYVYYGKDGKPNR